jgi:hydroxymethylpyrimidine/phosphomethylpyrimidine kinase
VFSTTAIACLTSQNTKGVNAIFPVSTEFIQKQIETILEDFEVDAIKIGMLGTKEITLAVKNVLKDFKNPIVLDPVAISRAGSKLLDDEAKEALISMFEIATIVTPNHFEAEYFNLSSDKTAKLPKANFLIKNIDPNSENAVDRLFIDGNFKRDFATPFAQKDNTHGTGCTYSTAIACNLALGFSLEEAIENSKQYIYKTIAKAQNIGNGNGPICHNLKD